MAKFSYTVTEANIIVLVDGLLIKIPKTHSGYRDLAQHLQGDEHDAETIKTLADKRAALARLTAGQVTVMGSTVYYRGAPIRSALSDRLVKLTDEGFDATPWALFMDKVMQNPSENSKERLFQFLERWDAPLTPDGDFIAFKGVRDDYSSTRTDPEGNKVYNRPGDVVKMDRDQVVEDPDITCASGLHACASHYLDSFWGTQNKVLALAINPRDVVSIPIDYNLSKMRVCRYEVIGDVEDTRHRDRLEHAQVVDQNAEGRVVPVAAPPVMVLNQEDRVYDDPLDQADFIYQGEEYFETDEDFDVDDIVVCINTGKIGKVFDRRDVTFRDEDHPEHDEWYDGSLSGDLIDDVTFVEVIAEDGETLTGAWNVNNGEEWPFNKLEKAAYPEPDEGEFHDYGYDEDGYYDESEPCENEQVVFEHAATGRSFGAKEVISIVGEIGQRGFARKFDIPRTTVQDWLRRANEMGNS